MNEPSPIATTIARLSAAVSEGLRAHGAVTLTPDTTITPLVPASRQHNLTLAQLQGVVGGYIEIIPTRMLGVLMVVNEQGHQLKLSSNPAATVLADEHVLLLPGGILGTVVLARRTVID